MLQHIPAREGPSLGPEARLYASGTRCSTVAILVHLAAEQMTDVSVRSETHHGVLTFLVTARRPTASD